MSLRQGNTAFFEEMSQWWQAVDSTVSDLTSPRFEPQTCRSRSKLITTQPPGRYLICLVLKIHSLRIQIWANFIIASRAQLI